MPKNLKIPFGIKNDKLVHINHVEESGTSCNCICPACGEELEARHFRKENYTRNHTDYFSHTKNSDCEHATESAIHQYAKQVIEENRRIVLPSLSHQFEHFIIETIIPSKSINIDEVILEKNINDFRPDVIAIANGQKLLIEIAVTHFVDNVKKNKIKDLDISAIEIDLNEYDFYIHDLEDLKEVILNSANRKWIYNKKEKALVEQKRLQIQPKINQIEKIFEENKRKARQKMEFYDSHSKKIIKRSSKGIYNNKKDLWHVSDCPLKKRKFYDEYYANVYLDCFKCKYYRNALRYQDKVVCLYEYYKNKK